MAAAGGWQALAWRVYTAGPRLRSFKGADVNQAKRSSYPRDLIGYGAHPPHAQWPGGARIALQFVLNYEEGAESNVLHGDRFSEAFLSESVGAPALEGVRNMNMESMYEYGARAGFWRLMRLFAERALPFTCHGVAMAMERNPAAVRAMLDAGHEIATHGYRWLDYQFVPVEQEQADMRRAIELHRSLTGERPLGWYLGRCSPNTARLVAEEGGFLYQSDSYADDLPYWDARWGKPQLVIPYALDSNDMRFATYQGFNTGDQFLTYLKDSFDCLYAEGAGAPKMLSVGLHCRLVGRPGRAGALARFLDYAISHDNVWICRRIDIARHWHAVHPYRPG